MRISALCLVASLFVLTGCPPIVMECIEGTEEVCDGGGSLPADFCSSREEADSDPTNCTLKVTTGGAPIERKQDVYISRLSDGGVDQDWYVAQMPANLTARSLLHVNGGYQGVPQTAVNFSLNVLKEGTSGLTTVVNGIDKHGPAAPKAVDLILPFAESSAKLYVLVGDEGISGQLKVDNRNAYSVFMEIIENPDANEPNDTVPTNIPLTGGQGTANGFLATNDDVDLYSFAVTGGSRQILYLHLTEMGMHPMSPVVPFRLSYTLFDPADVPIAEGTMENEFLTIDLATARLVGAAGTYKLRINGFKPATSMVPVKGHLTLNYVIDVRILPDLDMTEPNDTVATARAVTLGGNSSQSFTGKLAHVPDEEWFHITLPARASPSTLRYRVNVAGGGGRFAPLSATPARQFRLVQPVTMGATTQDRQTNCRTNLAACPRAADSDPMLHTAICASNDPPFCLWAERSEDRPQLADLRNFTGAVPIAANTASEWYLVFRDEGQGAAKYADDRDWTLVLEWRDDADEAARTGGPTVVNLGGSTVVANGELTFGYGRYFDDDWFMQGNRLRGLSDYDAIDSDTDTFQFNFGAATGDQSWEISWDLEHPDGGTNPPGELGFGIIWCAAGGGSSMLCPQAEPQRILAFNDQSLTPWYLPQSASNGRMLFTRQNMGSYTTYTAAPVGCWCHTATRTAAGQFFLDVAAIYRTSNEPLKYRVSQRLAAYPGGGFTVDGGAQTCPVADGGCGFAAR